MASLSAFGIGRKKCGRAFFRDAGKVSHEMALLADCVSFALGTNSNSVHWFFYLCVCRGPVL
jgi:hypothetical protein